MLLYSESFIKPWDQYNSNIFLYLCPEPILLSYISWKHLYKKSNISEILKLPNKTEIT